MTPLALEASQGAIVSEVKFVGLRLQRFTKATCGFFSRVGIEMVRAGPLIIALSPFVDVSTDENGTAWVYSSVSVRFIDAVGALDWRDAFHNLAVEFKGSWTHP